MPDFLTFLLQFYLIAANCNLLISALTSPQDISALKSFKSAIKPTSITPWSCLASWDFTAADPCALPRRTHFTCGITCSSDSTRVTQLTLDPAGYSGQLTPLISQLTSLTTLDLSENNLFGPIPPSISSLPNLQILILRSNSFSGSVPNSIANLKNLDSLDISHNSLSGYLPKSLDSMSSLRRLDLSYNKLIGSIPKLPYNLIELALRANSLSGSLPKSSFDKSTELEVVELGQNSFTGTLESWFFQLPGLQQVDLANNSFTRVMISNPVSGNSNLVAVDLSFNKIEGSSPANFAAYPLLSSLSMRYNRLRGAIPLEYSKKRSLRRLFLDGNFLTGKPPAAFFAPDTSVAGSLGDNCLQECPGSSQLCTPSQKPISTCKDAYDESMSKADQKFQKKIQFYTKVRDTVKVLTAQKSITNKKKLRSRQKKLKAYDLSNLSEFLPELKGPQQPTKEADRKVNCKSRQKLVLKEGQRLAMVVNHPAFLSDPLGAIHQHLKSTQPVADEKPKKKTSKKGATKSKGKKSKASTTPQAMEL